MKHRRIFYMSIRGSKLIDTIGTVPFAPDPFAPFYCYIDPNGIWVLSGFVKQTQKTPKDEIHKAQNIRKEVE